RMASGDLQRSRHAFLAAAALARQASDGEGLAEAALGLAGGGFEVPLFDREQTDLLEEALAALGPDRSALRARLCARLSVALSLVAPDAVRATLAVDAVRLAEESGDTASLAEALAAHFDAHSGPEHLAGRSRDASRIVDLAMVRRDHGLELLGRRLRI